MVERKWFGVTLNKKEGQQRKKIYMAWWYIVPLSVTMYFLHVIYALAGLPMWNVYAPKIAICVQVINDHFATIL